MFQTSFQIDANRKAANRASVARVLAVVAILVGSLAGATSIAEARMETVLWTHNQENVAGFRMYASANPGLSGSVGIADITLAEAAQNGEGVFFHTITIPDDATVYITLTAYSDENVESFRSNEKPLEPPLIVDSDGDGFADPDDVFPNDPNEWLDSDGDGTGDNGDQFPNDASEQVDTDGDGYGNNGDAFPNDSYEWLDTDGDGHGDNSDAFPNDPTRFEFTTTVSPYRVNAGANADLEAGDGRVWTRDMGFWNAGFSNTVAGDTTILGTDSPEIYRSSRTDSESGEEMMYSFPITSGSYTVRLHFAEHVHGGSQLRMFDVYMEGARVLQDFDIYESAGRRLHTAVVRNISVEVGDGVLEIEFVHLSGRSDPTVMGIEVVSQDALEGEVLTTPGKPVVLEVQ